MEQTKNKELSFTRGSVFQALIRFTLPVLGALVLQAAYGAVDLLVVGWFGDASSISAVGTGSTLMQMITAVISSLVMGVTVVIGQYIGERKPNCPHHYPGSFCRRSGGSDAGPGGRGGKNRPVYPHLLRRCTGHYCL